MIVFDLRCGQAHVFEAWFASTPCYEEQRARQLIACPLCDDTAITKAAMAPAIPAKANRGGDRPEAAKLLAAQRALEAEATYVGLEFAARARALHADVANRDEATPAPGPGIYGEASLADARALVEDGIPILPLPFRPRLASDA